MRHLLKGGQAMSYDDAYYDDDTNDDQFEIIFADVYLDKNKR